MSVEQFPQFGSPGHLTEGETVQAMQPLPGAIDWPVENQQPDELQRGAPSTIPPRQMPRRRWVRQFLVALLLAGFLGSGGVLYYLDQTFAGQIYPNISIGGVAVGHMTDTTAIAALKTRYEPFLQQPITLTYGAQTWTPTPEELGMRLEIEAAAQYALAAGRGHGFFDNLREVTAIWQSGLELPLHITIDQATMQRYILDRATEIDQPAVDASLSLQDAQLIITPAASGRQVSTNEVLYELTAALQTLEPTTVAFRTREIPPVLNDADVTAAREVIDALLQAPLTIRAGDDEWIWSVEELSAMITIARLPEASGDGDFLAVSLHQNLIRERVREIADATEQVGVYPRLNWADGKLEVFREGKPGKRINEARAAELIQAAAMKPYRRIMLPFVTIDPPVTVDNLGALGINELIAVGQSDFSGSAAYRITNIEAGMRLLHGVLIAPGEEFSFNDTVGAIDGSNGFVEGYAIVQNRTQLEWGGGICQDSTTLFRAAFWAGLPITERWGHSFYISWYDRYGFAEYGNGPGMDATIFTGGPDLKFVNDTGNWLLLQTVVDRSRALAEVRIYGTDVGRTVELIGPSISNRRPPPAEAVYIPAPSRPSGESKQTDTARGGMDIAFERIIQQDGAEIDRQEFVTSFRPWPDIFEINPADLGPDGKPLPHLGRDGRPLPPDQIPPEALPEGEQVETPEDGVPPPEEEAPTEPPESAPPSVND